jgi:hypothetical protein
MWRHTDILLSLSLSLSSFIHYRNDKTDLPQNIEEEISKFKEACTKQLGIEVENMPRHTKQQQ